MAKNPMQRKAQNSFLLGMLITLLITGIIIALLVMQLTKVTKAQKKEEQNQRSVCVLSQDITSGTTVTPDLLTTKTMKADVVPSNAISLAQLEELSKEYDKDGENLVKKIDLISKIDLKAGTIITSDMIAQSDDLAADLREQEYNMIVLPSQLATGHYIDIRLKLPNGKDFIVIPHKKVTIPEVDGAPSLNTISLRMQETEILTLSCAIVECYKIEGAILYANQYVEPGLQTAATATYLPDDETINLINRDPNCVTEAKQAIFQRNNDAGIKSSVRNPITSGLNSNSDQANDNAVSGLQAELQKAQEERQKYLESLGGSY